MKSQGQLKTWVLAATCRRKDYIPTIVSFQKDADDNITAVVGTVTLPVTQEDNSIASQTIDMLWQVNGMASVTDRSFDLVAEVSIDTITAE